MYLYGSHPLSTMPTDDSPYERLQFDPGPHFGWVDGLLFLEKSNRIRLNLALLKILFLFGLFDST